MTSTTSKPQAASQRQEIPGQEVVLGKSYPPAVKFEAPGVVHTIEVTDVRTEQDRDFESGELIHWPDGRPKMILAVVGVVDEDQPGTWWVRGRRAEAAVKAALKAAGVGGFAAGDVAVVVRGEDEHVEPRRKNAKVSPANTYDVTVTPAG